MLKMLNRGEKGDKTTAAERIISALETIKGKKGERFTDINECKDKEDDKIDKKKKLSSGKYTKPEEAGIQKVARFPHEQLDPRHTQEKDFEKLPFNLLLAGELELISDKTTPEVERAARIELAKTLCYHKLYLPDVELRDGYDQILKKVERGQQQWDPALGEHLHEFLNYRANLRLREKVAQTTPENGFTKVEHKKNQDRRNDKNDSTRIIYCQDFNNKRCNQQDHHEGRFAGGKVIRWHICKKCLEHGEVRSHRSSDAECPQNA